jgi:hypothetical protein
MEPSLFMLPTRLIDVTPTNPTLHITRHGEPGHYAALSHCWGGPQQGQTTRATLKAWTGGIPISDLPQTILDAVIVTRKLGLHFLWVDSLCIIQDDPEDQGMEISRMSQIYRQAYVTIVAASATNCNEGFLHVRSPSSASITVKLPYRCPDGTLGSIILEDHKPIDPFVI